MKYTVLVQNKRRKMLCLIIFLVLYQLINVAAFNLTYIITKDKDVIHPSCIAEELERYAAIGWVYPIPDNEQHLPDIRSKYIPNIDHQFNCKFSKNSVCNTRWSLRDWKVDENSARTYDVIMDSRWEDFPVILISNATSEFAKGIEIESTHKTAFSVRANGVVEIFICSGSNPYSYPCYHFHIDSREIYLNMYKTVPKNIENFKNNKLEYYKAYSDIISQKEWRTFTIDLRITNNIQLIDVNLNRTLIEHSFTESLTPKYMFMRSANASLWKIHQNNFFFTNTTHISRLGPQLIVNDKDLCISLFVSTCNNCEMIFFYQNISTKKILKHVRTTKNEEWMEIKLKEENISFERINLFVETKLIDQNKNVTGFWAIDEVRMCNENEVKVSFLKLNNISKTITGDDISCQLIKKPNWRPKTLTYDTIKDLPQIQSISNTSSIKLKWNQEDPTNKIKYFISYKANDICLVAPHNIHRLKSNGFLTTKQNEIVIDNLVPYTLYNITFSTALHENDHSLQSNTVETMEPTMEELPSNVQIRSSDDRVNVSWKPVSCQHKFGRLVYTLIVRKLNSNFSKSISLQTETRYEIDGLEPYTGYTLEIITGRTGRNIHNRMHVKTMMLSFSTNSAGSNNVKSRKLTSVTTTETLITLNIAPPVQSLELYAIDTHSAYLRYELPKNPLGKPKEVQVSKCNRLSFKKCKSFITPLRPCSLWPGKYCSELQFLTPYQNYIFLIGLKNFNSHTFGLEPSVIGYTNDRVPGKPTNITYKIVDCSVLTDYCHLNISWLHPYYQNGTITSFNIILNNTEEKMDAEEAKYIHEIYKIENNTYYPYYTYQIKYLPYSTSYSIYLQSVNKVYRSDFTKTTIKTDNLGDHIDQSPKLTQKTHSSLTFKLPHLDRRLDHYTVTIVVQDFNSNKSVDNLLLKNQKINDNLCHKYGETWVSYSELKIDSNNTNDIIIGKEKQVLQPKTKYCITFIITNKYKKSEHDVVYYEKVRTADYLHSPGQYNHLYLLFLVLLLVPIGFLIHRYMRKKKYISRPTENIENDYESLPINGCEGNRVRNENYDK